MLKYRYIEQGDSLIVRANKNLIRWQRGFTIVELLVVIVIIAILAAIATVAYNGAQERAKDTKTDTAVHTLKQTLELYKLSNKTYPAACPGGDNTSCNVSYLGTYLVPREISSLPSSSTTLSYIRGTGGTAYGILIDYLSKADCKTGVNVSTGWWGTGVPIC